MGNGHHPYGPSGASWHSLTNPGCAPSCRQRERNGGTAVSAFSTVEQLEESENALGIKVGAEWSLLGVRNPQEMVAATVQTVGRAAGRANLVETTTALSVEFVAKPGAAQTVRELVPGDIEAAFGDVEGYAGCMILTSDQEARLVTVITMWSGAERARRCNENTKWVRGLLKPYVDRWLRTQTLVTSLRGARQIAAGVGR